jgi:hypothetical protein
MHLQISASCVRTCLAALLAVAACSSASAQSEGGLYVAGSGFGFQVAAERAISQNPGGRRFFLLTLPSEAAALDTSASPSLHSLRERVIAANGVLLVCQRDLDNGALDAARLADGVVPVRGWPKPGADEIPAGQRYFPNEDRSTLPAANEALRRLRSSCS